MSRLEVLGVGLAVGLFAGLLIGSSMARGATPRPLAEPAPSWTPVELASEAPRGTSRSDPDPDALDASRARAEDERRSPAGDASPAQVTDAPRVTPPTNGPSPNVSKPAPSTRVSLTWYCRAGVSRCTRGYPDRSGVADLFAAASPDLAYLRGKVVSVCLGGRCVSVRVIDCNCQAVRSLDLYADAFAKLASLGAGRLTGATVGVSR